MSEHPARLGKWKKNKGGKMAREKFYWFTFSDGYRVCVRGFSKQEMAIEVQKHGKLVFVKPT
jgi:hypothetical protein